MKNLILINAMHYNCGSGGNIIDPELDFFLHALPLAAVVETAAAA
jgi:hypothetical protein